jgi:ABC-type uncharacterized transport system ATPase subunit
MAFSAQEELVVADEAATKARVDAGPSQRADVQITSLRIAGFRGIDDMTLELAPGATFLVGENNAGKTSILYALAVAFGARQPVRDDLLRKGGVLSAGSFANV